MSISNQIKAAGSVVKAKVVEVDNSLGVRFVFIIGNQSDIISQKVKQLGAAISAIDTQYGISQNISTGFHAVTSTVSTGAEMAKTQVQKLTTQVQFLYFFWLKWSGK